MNMALMIISAINNKLKGRKRSHTFSNAGTLYKIYMNCSNDLTHIVARCFLREFQGIR
jgi:hypothetical protein